MRYFRRTDPYAPQPRGGIIVLLVLAVIGLGLFLAVRNAGPTTKVEICQLVGLMRCDQIDPRDVPMLPPKPDA